MIELSDADVERVIDYSELIVMHAMANGIKPRIYVDSLKGDPVKSQAIDVASKMAFRRAAELSELSLELLPSLQLKQTGKREPDVIWYDMPWDIKANPGGYQLRVPEWLKPAGPPEFAGYILMHQIGGHMDLKRWRVVGWIGSRFFWEHATHQEIVKGKPPMWCLGAQHLIPVDCHAVPPLVIQWPPVLQLQP